MLQSGARVLHFGAPMDLPSALAQLRPTSSWPAISILGVFARSTPDQVRAATRALIEATRRFKNYILSSGCDIPPRTPMENIEAFYEAARQTR